MEFLDVLDFPIFVVGCRKNKKYLQDFNAFVGWAPSNDLAAGILGMSFKTEPTSLSKIDGV